MKNLYKGILAVLTVFLYTGNTYAQSNNYEFRIIYSFMKAKDVAGLKNAVTNGVWIDSPDSNGINSLCHAIYQKDYDGYDLLRNMSADPNPPCLRRMSPHYRNAFFDNKPGYDRYAFLNPTEKKTFFTPRMQTVGTTALLTGMAAGVFAISGSGGGGGDDGNGGSGDGNIQWTEFEVAPTDSMYLTASPQNGNPDDYKTAEVTGSGFLEQINAPNAYARGYDGRKVYRTFKKYQPAGDKPELVDIDYTYSDEVINVAVYDNGVWANNIKLKDNIVKFNEENGGGTFGFNFDFGPCTSVNKTMCYSFDAVNGKLMLQTGEGQTPTAIGNYTQEAWDRYISHFAADYVWNITNTTPHYLNGPQENAPEGYDPNEINGHGTHVAGIIGAKPVGGYTQGVVPNVGLIPFIYNQFGNINTDISLLNSSIKDYGSMMNSSNQDIQIVNMSYGPSWQENLNASSYGDYFKEHGALDTFFNDGHILVVAAGNESKDEAGVFSAIPKEVSSADGLFITVVAVDPNNQLADYSNKCGSSSNWCIAAPGGTDDNPIKSTYGEDTIAGMSGTSMAAPVVSGSLAMIMSAFPNLTPQQAVQILFETATDLGDASIYGHGLVNLDAATKPIGVFEVPTEDTVSGESVALNGSRIAVPYNMANIIEKLPQQMIFLDKYDRPYPLATKSLFTTSNHNKKLENDMKQFTNRNKVSKVAVNDNLSMSFSNRVSDPIDNMQLGSFGFDYMLDKDTSIGFFFSENTAYKNGDYFAKATGNPFLNMNEAYGIKSEHNFNTMFGFDVALYTGKNGFYNDDQRLKLQNDNEFNAIDYVFNFTPADFITFGFKGGFLQEDGSVLGMNGSGAFATENSLTNYVGLEIGLNPTEELSITAAYYQGRTKTHSAKSNTLMSLSDIKSESISLDVGYKLSQENKLGLQIAQPLAINRGSMLFDLPVGRDPKEDIVYREKYNLALKPEARELDLGLYFTHETKKDKWLRVEFGTRINPDNQDVVPDYRMMLGFGAPLN